MAKVRIDKLGYLEIERKGKMSQQFCMNNPSQRCGDWCPAFEEPEKAVSGNYLISLCNTEIYADECTDER